MITYNHKYEQFVASGFLDFEPLRLTKEETMKGTTLTLAPGTILFNKKGKFFFQLLGELKIPASPATYIGYMAGSVVFQGPAVSHFSNTLRDCYIPDTNYIENYNKSKSI